MPLIPPLLLLVAALVLATAASTRYGSEPAPTGLKVVQPVR